MKKILFGALSAAAISAATGQTLVFDFEAGNPTAGNFSGDASQVLSDSMGNLFTLAVVEPALFTSASLNTAADFGSGGSTFVFTGPPAAGTGILQLFAGDLSGEANAPARATGTPLQFTLNSFDAGNNGASTTIAGISAGAELFSVSTDASNTNPNTYVNFTNGAGLVIDTIEIRQTADTNNVNRYDNFNVTVVPEPSSALLLGAAGLFGLARRRR